MGIEGYFWLAGALAALIALFAMGYPKIQAPAFIVAAPACLHFMLIVVWNLA